MDTVKKKEYDKLIWSTFFGNIFLERGIFILLLFHKGFTIGEIALWQSLLNIGMFLGEVPTGFIADMIGKKISLIIGRFFIIIYYMILIVTNNYTWLYLSAFIFGVGTTFITGTDEVLLYDILLTGDSKIINTSSFLGRFSAVTIITIGLSILLGGFVQKLGWEILLIICLLGQFISIIFIKGIRIPKKSNDSEKKTLKMYIDAIKFEMKHKESLFLLLTLGINVGVISALYILAQDELKTYGLTIPMISIFFAIEATLSFLLLFNLDKLKEWVKDRRGLLISSLLSIMFFILLGAKNKYIFIISVLAISVISNFFSTILMDKLNHLIKPSIRATIISLFNSLSALIMAGIFVIISKLEREYMIFIILTGITSYLIMILYIIFYLKEKAITENVDFEMDLLDDERDR